MSSLLGAAGARPSRNHSLWGPPRLAPNKEKGYIFFICLFSGVKKGIAPYSGPCCHRGFSCCGRLPQARAPFFLMGIKTLKQV